MTSKRQLLLTPGPSAVPDPVLEAMRLPMIHHRTKEFIAILERVNGNLKKVFATQNPVVTFASSGTGAMEAAIVNLFSAGDRVIACHAGKFGERFRDIAVTYGLNVVNVQGEYGKPIPVDAVAAALKQYPDAKGVLSTHLETSTATLHPIEKLAALTRDSQAVLLVDAVSGLACDVLKTDEWGVDVVVSGSQKALMLAPGLGFMSVSPKAEKLISTSKLPKYYFHLGQALKAFHKNDTPYTPAVSLIRGLAVSLEMILAEGLELVWRRHAETARFVRDKAGKMGFSTYSESPSNALTGIRMPEGLKSSDLIKRMNDHSNVVMADGQGELQGRIVRFAHMGDTARVEAAEAGYAAFAEALAFVGRPVIAH